MKRFSIPGLIFILSLTACQSKPTVTRDREPANQAVTQGDYLKVYGDANRLKLQGYDTTVCVDRTSRELVLGGKSSEGVSLQIIWYGGSSKAVLAKVVKTFSDYSFEITVDKIGLKDNPMQLKLNVGSDQRRGPGELTDRAGTVTFLDCQYFTPVGLE